MRHLAIYIDKNLEDRGYSGVKYYEDQDGYMTLGSTNEGGQPRLWRMTAHFNLFPDVTVNGGEKENFKLQELLTTWKPHTWGIEIPTINRFMWSLLIDNITQRQFIDLMVNAREAGFQEGQKAARTEIREALGL